MNETFAHFEWEGAGSNNIQRNTYMHMYKYLNLPPPQKKKTSIHSLVSEYEIIQSNTCETMPIHDKHCWIGHEFQVFVQV